MQETLFDQFIPFCARGKTKLLDRAIQIPGSNANCQSNTSVSRLPELHHRHFYRQCVSCVKSGPRAFRTQDRRVSALMRLRCLVIGALQSENKALDLGALRWYGEQIDGMSG